MAKIGYSVQGLVAKVKDTVVWLVNREPLHTQVQACLHVHVNALHNIAQSSTHVGSSPIDQSRDLGLARNNSYYYGVMLYSKCMHVMR